MIILESSGLPDHAIDLSFFQQGGGEDTRQRRRLSAGGGGVAPHHWKAELPLNPKVDWSKPFQDEWAVGTLPVDSPIGFAINGVPFFSPLSADGIDLVHPPPGYNLRPGAAGFIGTETSTVFGSDGSPLSLTNPEPLPRGLAMDPCMGSLSPDTGAYNYRTMPPCLFGLNAKRFDMAFDRLNVLHAYSPLTLGRPSPLIGFALDGHAIYGPYDEQGQLHQVGMHVVPTACESIVGNLLRLAQVIF
jgi:hypothetical protein